MSSSRRVTLATVAQAAGVSVSTASAALSGTGRVSPATADRVRGVAVELGYRVDPSARQLRSDRARAVGVVIDTAAVNLDSNQSPAMWWPRAIFALVDELANHNIVVQLISAKTETDWPTLAVDAVITVERPGGHTVRPQGLPYGTPIFFGGDLDSSDDTVTQIAPDFDSVCDLALSHLAKRGAQRIGLLTLAARISFAAHVEASYERWCSQQGQQPIVVGRNGGAPALLVDELLTRGCDSIFSISNASAEILKALMEQRRVPDQCKLLVLSEGLVEEHLRPRVTVVSLDGARAGRMVAEQIVKAINADRPSSVRIEPLLILGEST